MKRNNILAGGGCLSAYFCIRDWWRGCQGPELWHRPPRAAMRLEVVR